MIHFIYLFTFFVCVVLFYLRLVNICVFFFLVAVYFLFVFEPSGPPLLLKTTGTLKLGSKLP